MTSSGRYEPGTRQVPGQQVCRPVPQPTRTQGPLAAAAAAAVSRRAAPSGSPRICGGVPNQVVLALLLLLLLLLLVTGARPLRPLHLLLLRVMTRGTLVRPLSSRCWRSASSRWVPG